MDVFTILSILSKLTPSLVRVLSALLSFLALPFLTSCIAVPTSAKQDSPNVHVQQQQQTAPGQQHQEGAVPAPTATNPAGSSWPKIVEDPLFVAVGAAGTTATVCYLFYRIRPRGDPAT